ncbi:OsmC family peroxiredoxin [Mesorhizobium sp. M8A.F.Ca.ET.173.01.1.1]|nr:OsmC family peroxiredoxin [Mesorhizobium sp. M8A.F.Ca.ET.173.01.1.1]
MSIHKSILSWERAPHPEDPATYSRNHIATLSGGQQLRVSASVDYKGDKDSADPEQMVVSAVSSCHMLFFLAIAESQGLTVDRYEDRAVGYVEKGSAGRPVITRIELSPAITFGGDKIPNAAAISRMHAGAHKNCFIGNSLTAEVVIKEGTLCA